MPGKIVKCKDGAIGRTVNGRPAVNGKIPLDMLVATEKDFNPYIRYNLGYIASKLYVVNQRRLSDPKTLTVIGYYD